MTGQTDQELREKLIELMMKRRGCDRAEAVVILRRVGDRLAGYTHEEVARMHPLPTEDE